MVCIACSESVSRAGSGRSNTYAIFMGSGVTHGARHPGYHQIWRGTSSVANEAWAPSSGRHAWATWPAQIRLENAAVSALRARACAGAADATMTRLSWCRSRRRKHRVARCSSCPRRALLPASGARAVAHPRCNEQRGKAATPRVSASRVMRGVIGKSRQHPPLRPLSSIGIVSMLPPNRQKLFHNLRCDR
jgi:hypothetical protein